MLIIQIILGAFCTAQLTRFLAFCLAEGNILHGYYKWLLKVSDAQFVQVVDNGEVYEQLTSAKWFYKPLGGCDVCMNFWLCLPGFFYLAIISGVSIHLGFFAFWAFQSLSFFFLDKTS
jgi:hypothetical protein